MRFMITGGGTGGHVFPGVAVAEALHHLSAENEILFVGTRQGLEARLLPELGYDLRTVPASGLRGLGWLARVRFVVNLIWGFAKSLLLIVRWRPDVILSTGGYVGVPVMLAGRLLRRRLALQEQNSMPGSANRMLARWSRRIYLGFAEAAAHFPGCTTSHTGNPVRRELVESLGEGAVWSWDGHRPLRVLVYGGSRGARSLNRALIEAAPAWRDRPDLELWLQTGTADHSEVATAYGAVVPDADAAGAHRRIVAFIHDMPAALGWADLVVCRAGAMSLAELAVAGRPAILVPFPFATDDHQTRNAEGFAAAGAAQILPDSRCRGDILSDLIEELAAAPSRLEAMALASRSHARPDAARDVAVDLMDYAGASKNLDTRS